MIIIINCIALRATTTAQWAFLFLEVGGVSKCKTCAFMCKKDNVKSCPTHEYSGIYVHDLEQQNTEMTEFIKQMYSLECTTSAFDFQCMLRGRIIKFRHRNS